MFAKMLETKKGMIEYTIGLILLTIILIGTVIYVLNKF